MSLLPRLRIAVFSGDGIGPEVTAACVELLHEVARRLGAFALEFEHLEAGATVYLEQGQALPPSSMERAKGADAILLAAMGLPDVRYPDGTEVSPQLDLRFELGLYAGLRPVRAVAGVPSPLSDSRAHALDFVLVRESTEGLFASHDRGVVEHDQARDTLVVTRKGSERVFDFAFELARKRGRKGKGSRVTCVDKANVFRSFAYFREIFFERARRFPDVEADAAYVDAVAHGLVRHPWRYDVLVTENMFGDILSDLGAGLIGGMGMAPSADIGDEHAVFQPCHGSAPDIAGEGKANPTAMFLSAALMLEWLGDRRDVLACAQAAGLIRDAVDAAFLNGTLRPFELGGDAGTRHIAEAVMTQIQSNPPGARLRTPDDPDAAGMS